ncbi:hypothetical protein QFZ53_003635 [Microbacterium natoriense]|uniref:HNH nuclease domain-containing protein n=1 Tax=Microbacterium natoriense TaxID=284570 RepID=A0AAW8F3H3_9MICO|nr:HNH endonuclease signature motif containing protein [Microbacterium natoriense]MDQ0649439.1 hypothetical protein [Microbacterium natoriense]
MNSTVSALARVATDLRAVLSDDALAGLSDAERAEALRGAGEVSRLVDAVVVEAVASAEVEFGHRFGCRGMNELLQRALLTDAPSASKFTRAAGLVARDVNLVSGERLPARWPALRDALLDGAVGIPGLLAATAPIEYARARIGTDERLWVDEVLAGHARGLRDTEATDGAAQELEEDAAGDTDPSVEADADTAAGGKQPGPPATADDLRHLASTLAMILDPDGAEPTDRDAQQGRFLNLGRLQKGAHRLVGNITPEVAAQLQQIFDAFNNPKVGGAPAPGVAFTETAGDDEVDEFNVDPRNVIDPRTPGQKRHDALAAALGIAARHEEMPSLGGAAPTLVVHVDAKDLAAGTGWATLPGNGAPVPLSVAAHTACTGAVQRVLFDEGRIVGITTTDRIFNAHQRRAIVARDRECLIPGCHVPASWCEIHHVTEHARGGPTHTDNGVPLCWWHHRSLDHSGWEIRMNDGIPQIRGPAWWDPAQRWRTPRHSTPAKPARRTVLRT